MISILIALTLAAGPVQESVPTWVEATSRDGRFSFAMPEKATEKASTRSTPDGPIDVIEYATVRGKSLYRIESAKLPVAIPAEKREGALAAIRDSIARKNPLIVDAPTVVNGWPARRIDIDAPLAKGQPPCRIAILIVYDEDHLYQARAFSLDPDRPPAEVGKFFAGFVLKTKP